jgi:hypothetical protein
LDLNFVHKRAIFEFGEFGALLNTPEDFEEIILAHISFISLDE